VCFFLARCVFCRANSFLTDTARLTRTFAAGVKKYAECCASKSVELATRASHSLVHRSPPSVVQRRPCKLRTMAMPQLSALPVEWCDQTGPCTLLLAGVGAVPVPRGVAVAGGARRLAAPHDRALLQEALRLPS
jgi:hypothetical protein